MVLKEFDKPRVKMTLTLYLVSNTSTLNSYIQCFHIKPPEKEDILMKQEFKRMFYK